MTNKLLTSFLESKDRSYIHASNLRKKYQDEKDSGKKSKVRDLIIYYLNNYRTVVDSLTYQNENWVFEMVQALNDYYDYFDKNDYSSLYTSQSKFRPTILEEFCYCLCKIILDDVSERLSINKIDLQNIEIGHTNAYTNAFFSPTDFVSFLTDPSLKINTKAQDFCIYRKTSILLDGQQKPIIINIPILSIECKTYIDKTMLDTCIADADKIKTGNPYSKLFVVTES